MIPIILLVAVQMHINVMFSDNAGVSCGYQNIPLEENTIFAGCQYNSKHIIIQLGMSEEDTRWIIAHEEGHLLFNLDKDVQKELSSTSTYPDLFGYPSSVYGNDFTTERIADYFAAYVYDKDFAKKYPKLKKIFDKKLYEDFKINN